MSPKISLTAAFLLLTAPPFASGSTRSSTIPRPTARAAHQSRPGMVVVQEEPSAGTTDADNDSDNDNDNDNKDSNDSADDNQNADANQGDQQNAGTDQQADPQTMAPDTDSGNAQPMNAYPVPVNPYQ